MAGLGEVKVSLALDTAQAQAQLKQFFGQIGQQKVADPLKPLETSFTKLQAKAKELGYTWDQTTQSFKNSAGVSRTIDQIQAAVTNTAKAAKEGGTSFTQMGQAFQNLDAQGKAFTGTASQASSGMKSLGGAASSAGGQLKALPIVALNQGLASTNTASGSASKAITLVGTSTKTASTNVLGLSTAAKTTGGSLQQLGKGSTTGIDQISTSSKTASGSLAGLSTAAGSTKTQLGGLGSTGATGITQVGTASKTATTSVAQLGTASKTTSTSLISLGQGSTTNVGKLGDIARATTTNITGLGAAGNTATGQLQSLGTGATEGIRKIGDISRTTTTDITGLGTAGRTADTSLQSLGGGATQNIGKIGDITRTTTTDITGLGNAGKATSSNLQNIQATGLSKVSTEAKGAKGSMDGAATGAKTLGTSLQQVGTAGKGLDLTKIALSGVKTEAQGATVPVGTLNNLLSQGVKNPYDPLKVSLQNLGTAAGQAAPDLKNLNAQLQEGASVGKQFSDAIKVGFEQLIIGIPQGIGMAIGNQLIAPFTQLTQIIPAAVEEYRAMDEVLRLTLAVAGESSSEFGTLQAAVQEVGTAAAGTNAEVAQVAKTLAAAGFSLDEIKDALGGIVMGAEATGTSYDEMADIVVSALGQFRLSADQTVDVVDTLVVGANAANQSITDIGYALKYVGPVAASTKQSLEDVSIALGLLANNGIKGSTAGTSLRTILTNLQIAAGGASQEFMELSKGAGKYAEVLQLIGAQMTKSNGELKSGTALIYALQDAMGGLSAGEQAIVSKVLAGAEGLPAMNALIGATKEQVEGMADALENRAGAAAESQRKAMEGLAGSFKQLEGNISVLLGSIGALISTALKPMIDFVVKILSAFNSLPGPIQNIIILMTGLTAALGTAAAAMVILQSEMVASFAAPIIAGVQKFIATLVAGNIPGVISAWVASFGSLSITLAQNLTTGLQSATTALNSFNQLLTAGSIAQGINNMTAGLGALSQILKTQLGAAMATAITSLKAFAEALKQINIQQTIANITSGLSNFKGAVTTNLKGALDGAKDGLSNFGNLMKDLPKQFSAGAQAAKNAGAGFASLGPAIAAAGEGAAVAGPAVAGAGTAAAAAGTGAAAGAAGFGGLLTALGGFLVAAAPVAAIAGVVALAIGSIATYAKASSEMAGKLEGQTNKLNAVLKEGGDAADKSGEKFTWWYDSMTNALGPLGSLIKMIPGLDLVLKATLGTVQLIGEGFKKFFGWIEDNGKIDAAKKAHEELGKALGNVNQKLEENKAKQAGLATTSKEWRTIQAENIRLETAAVQAIQGRIKAIDSELASLEASGKGNDRVAQALRDQKKELEAQLGPRQENLTKMQQELTEADKLAGTNTRVQESYAGLSQARQQAYAQIDVAVQQAELVTMAEVSKGLLTEAEARAINAKAALEASDKKLAADQEYLANLEQLVKEGKATEEELAKAKQEVTERVKESLKDRMETEKALKEAVKAAIEERLAKYQEEQQRIAQNVQAINASLRELGQINVSGINAFKQLADASTQYEITGIEKVKAARLKAIDETYKDGAAKDAAKAQAEMEYESQKKKILQENQTFQEKAAQAMYQAKLAELALWEAEQTIVNQIAQVEAQIAIEKAKASGASAQEIEGLNKVLELTKFQGEMIGTQADLKREVLGIEQQVAEAQLATKARADGVATAYAGSVANVKELGGQMDAFTGKVQAVADKATEFKNTLGTVGTETAEQVANEVRDKINRGLGEIDPGVINQKLGEIGVPPAVASALGEEITRGVASGAAAGVDAAKMKLTELGNVDTIPKQLIEDNLVAALQKGGRMGKDAAKAEFDKLPDAVNFDQLATLLGKSVGKGTEEGRKMLNQLNLDKEAVDKIQSGVKEGLQKGSESGTAALSRAVQEGTPKMEAAVQQGVKGGLNKSEQDVTDWSNKISNTVQSSLAKTSEGISTGFKGELDKVLAQMGTGIAALADKLDSAKLKQKMTDGLMPVIDAAKKGLSELTIPSNLSQMGKDIAKALQDAARAGLSGEMSKVQGASARTKSNLSPAVGYLSRMASYASNLARDMERAASASSRIKTSKWTGGPVSPGSTYTVNELGPEMFLSNSGHLSEIKVPAFGNWSPPSSGQVIPAHIANQVREARENAKVSKAMTPMGGPARMASATFQQVTHESSGLQRALVSELRKLGDNPGSVSNQITIQSTKPVNDASRMLAEMGRLKAHRRY